MKIKIIPESLLFSFTGKISFPEKINSGREWRDELASSAVLQFFAKMQDYGDSY